MASVRACIAAWLGVLALTATARAADPAGSWPPPPDLEKAIPQLSTSRSGFYLRGDVGYRYNSIGSVESATAVTSRSYESAATVGLGLGYKYQWLRADLTVDYGLPAKFTGTTATASTQPQYHAKIDSFTVLANAYADLGTLGGFTPYVGAGVGTSYLRSFDFSNSALASTEVMTPASKWNFTWAAMAGFNIQVLPNWSMDIGYRYLKLGDAISSNDLSLNHVTFKSLSAQEVRIGLRFLLD